MRRFVISIAATLCAVVAVAQSPKMAVEGVVKSANGYEVSVPSTTICVEMLVQSEQVTSGPYARYAQKYLGVRAPLTDKVRYSILSANIFDAELVDQKASSVINSSESVTPSIAIDARESGVLPLEEAAQKAAATIFSLRKTYTEYLTGMMGDNVYGEGLEAVLSNIKKMEQEYLKLFLGESVITKTTCRFMITPTSGEKQFVVARFTEEDGILPISDLSGEAISLQIDPGVAQSALPVASDKDRVVVTCRVAAPSVCTLLNMDVELSQVVIPIYQYGSRVQVVPTPNM